MPWGDVGRGYRQALRAYELEGPESRWRCLACWGLGVGHHFRGTLEAADRWYGQAAEHALRHEQWLIAASALAYRSLLLGELGRLDEQTMLAEDASTLAREHGVEEVAGAAHVALGVAYMSHDKLREAVPFLERGVAVLRASAQPLELCNALVWQATALRASGDRAGAAAVLAEARAVVDACVDPGFLGERVTALEHANPERTGDRPRVADAALSERELAVLRLLRSQLSERDIGRELHLSHNTVHSHPRSIYRKLGVTSRAEAVQRAHALHLV